MNADATAFRWQTALLVCAAAVAMLIVIVRAYLQSIVIDEADTYLLWAAPAYPAHWWPKSNNHVLNSMLMRLATTIFRPSAFTVRLPAMAGAALYISAILVVCRLLSSDRTLRLVLFACLAFNPFVLDYLVAARGYSLALGFLLWTITIPVYALGRAATARPPYAWCAAASLCAALSFAANVSFALIDASAIATVLLWAAFRECPRFASWKVRTAVFGRLLAACLLPGLVAGAVLCGSFIYTLEKGELVVGASSWREAFLSVLHASVYEPNPYLLNPLLLVLAENLRGLVLPLLGITFVVAAASGVTVHLLRRTKDSRPARAAVAFALMLAAALAAHEVAFRAAGVLLPRDRTASFIAPLVMLIGGAAIAAAPRWFRRAGVAALFIAALYFAGCVRLTYFQEWKVNADMEDAYSVLAYYNHVYGVKEASAFWFYTSSLNFYRKISGREDLAEFPRGAWLPYPPGQPLYVLDSVRDAEFAAQQKLEIVWRGRRSDAVIAVRPGLVAVACPDFRGISVPQTLTQKRVH